MRITHHIPMEQYGFTEVEYEIEDGKSIDSMDLMLEYQEFKKHVVGVGGLPRPEWCKAIDRYISTGTMDANIYEQMNLDQKRYIQELKKCFKRIKRKGGDIHEIPDMPLETLENNQ